MPKFKYVGDPNDKFNGPEIMVQFGRSWRKGEAVEVSDESDDDKKTVAKLKGHSHFVDLSDDGRAADVAARQETLEKQETDRAKAAEEQRTRDAAEAKEIEDRRQKALEATGNRVPAENAPRPPGQVTRDPTVDPFQGRTVEQRTQTEDHTKAGKTKG